MTDPNFRLGTKGEVLIPLCNAHTGKFQTLQRIYPKPLPSGTDKLFFSGAPIDGACYTFEPEEEINERMQFVCEGIATGQAVFNLAGRKYRVTCAMSANNLLKTVTGLRKHYPDCEAFIMAADNDLQTEARGRGNAGRKEAQSVVKEGLAKGIVIPDFKPNEDGSDWNDYVFLHGEKKAAEDFNQQLGYVLSQPSTPPAKSGADTGSKKDIFSMRDDFLDGRNLIFYGSIKRGDYYGYDNDRGWWYQMSDAALQSMIAEHFNFSIPTRTINDLTAQVRYKITHMQRPPFNKKPLLGFSNCVLELDTFNDRGYRADDFLTWQVGYPYDENANCPIYDDFLPQAANNEASRVSFLDEIAAYILFPDCHLQKLFFLIGDGGNGKGTYLHVLDQLFRNSNPHEQTQSVTNIQPKAMKEDTKIIMLEHSLVNLAYDIDPDLRGCEEIIKSISSGDMVSGNLKFHDTHSFISRCKLISSCNKMPVFSDGSYGMERRPMFCRFDAVFKNPDTHLLDKLKGESSGIMNRILRIYKLMLEREAAGMDINQIITPTIDQKEMLYDFSVIANPVLAFWNEFKAKYLYEGEVSKQAVYAEYCEWYRLNRGRKAEASVLNENIFHKNLQQTLKKNGNGISERRKTIASDDGSGSKRRTYYIFDASDDAAELSQVRNIMLGNTEN